MVLPEDFRSQLSFLSQEDKEGLEASLLQEPTVSIRLNSRKWSRADLEPIPWSRHGYYLDRRPSFTSDPLFHAGAYYVQEPSSMVIGTVIRQLLAAMEHPVKVLDLCGAPGGKSTDIANQLRDGDTLVSNEVIASRVHVLKENVVKSGTANHHVCSNDPADFKKLPGLFDIVVVDAPCSGEGMFRKDHDSVDHWSLKSVEFCQQRQHRILEDVWDTLKEGGVLVYSTCTFNESENEDVLRRLISDYDISPAPFVPDTDWSFWTCEVGGFTQFKVLPNRSRGEGFSFFVIRKNEPTSAASSNRKKRGKGKQPTLPVFHLPQLGDEDIPLYKEEDRVLTYSDQELMTLLSQNLRMVKKGTLVGTLKKDRLIPSYELALATFVDHSKWPTYELDYDAAISFLRKDPILPPSEKKGFGLVTYRNVPLGWINHLGNRANNLHPSEYRILARRETLEEPGIL